MNHHSRARAHRGVAGDTDLVDRSLGRCALVVGATIWAALAGSGCMPIRPEPTPPPTVVDLAARLAETGMKLEFVRTEELGPNAVSAEQAVKRALRQGESGTVTTYPVLVHGPDGVHPAWLVVQSELADPALAGRLGRPLEFAIIDALTGNPLDSTIGPAFPSIEVPPGFSAPSGGAVPPTP